MSFLNTLSDYGKAFLGGDSDQSWSDVGREKVAQKFGNPLKKRPRRLSDYGTASPAPSPTAPAMDESDY